MRVFAVMLASVVTVICASCLSAQAQAPKAQAQASNAKIIPKPCNIKCLEQRIDALQGDMTNLKAGIETLTAQLVTVNTKIKTFATKADLNSVNALESRSIKSGQRITLTTGPETGELRTCLTHEVTMGAAWIRTPCHADEDWIITTK